MDADPQGDAPFDRAASWRAVVIWLAIGALWRALLAAAVPLLPDETYYWDWSRHLQLSYFDHPPVIALLIRAGTLVFGDTTFGIRIGPAVAGIVSSMSLTLLANNLGGVRAAVRAAAVSTVLPMATLGLVLATPDSPLMATVTIALLALERALAAPRRSAHALGWWIAAGIAAGASMATKYTAVLLPLSFMAVALVHPALRRRFAEPGPWVAGLVALLVFSPVVIWNAQNNWISFRFQLNHGFGQFVRGTSWQRELEYVGAQIGLASPVLFVLLARATRQALLDAVRAGLERWRRHVDVGRAAAAATDDGRRLALAATVVTTFVFFGASAWRRPVEANWPALMYPAAMALLATTVTPWAIKRAWNAALFVAILVSGIATLQVLVPILPLDPPKDPIARAYGWDALANSVDRARHDPSLAQAPQRWIASTRYDVSAQIAFHLPDQPYVHCLWLDGRPNQYDFWLTLFDQAKPGDALVAVFDADDHGDKQAATVAGWFFSHRIFETVEMMRGNGVIKRRRVWLFLNAQHLPAPDARLPGAWVAR